MRPLLLVLALLFPASAHAVNGGRAVTDSDHGFAVRINLVDTTCGGTLVAPAWVLTAAHCSVLPGVAAVPDPGALTVYAGRVRTSDTSAGMEVGVSRIVQHPGYAGAALVNLRYPDVALLELEEAVPYATLQVAGPEEAALWAPNVVGEVAGWGTDAVSGGPSDVLRAVALPVLEDAACEERRRGSSVSVSGTTVTPLQPDLETSFCAGTGDGRAACSGDSGAALTVPAYGGRRIAGVVSEGSGCGDFSSIFARVAAPDISAWVESVVPGTVGRPPPPPPPAPAPAPAPAASPPAAARKPTTAERRRAAAKKRAAAKRRAAARKRAAAKRRAAARKRAAAKRRAAARKRAAAKRRAATRKRAAAKPRAATRKRAATKPRAATRKRAATKPRAAARKRAAAKPGAAARRKRARR